MTKRPIRFFWATSWLQGGMEAMGMYMVVVALLVLLNGFDDAESNNLTLFMTAFSPLWFCLRVSMVEGRFWNKVKIELIYGAALILIMFSVLLVTHLVPWQNIFGDNFLVSLPILAGLTFGGYYFLRVPMYLWVWWSEKQRKRLLWAMTQSQINVVLFGAVLGFFVVWLAMAATTFNFSGSVVSNFLLLAIPLAGLVIIAAGIALIVIVPPAIFFSYLIARRTTRRLEALAKATADLRRGDFSSRVEVVGEDEVAQLQSDFNTMADDLQKAVTELKVERDRVEQLLKDRRELVASVSHELRTPVATIKGYLESAEKRDGCEQDTALQDDLQVMERELKRLQTLLEDLFTLSRAEVGQLTMNLVPMDAGVVAKRVAETFAPLAYRSARVEVNAQVAKGLPSVKVDENRLSQVLLNLVRNAVRFTPPGGVVMISAEPLEDGVALRVRDTGCGIPEEDLARIWERFYRTKQEESVDEQSAGLGLALVKELAEAMNGRVSVESKPGEGSCFTVWFPANQPA